MRSKSTRCALATCVTFGLRPLCIIIFHCFETDENDWTLEKLYSMHGQDSLKMNPKERSLANGCVVNGLKECPVNGSLLQELNEWTVAPKHSTRNPTIRQLVFLSFLRLHPVT